MCTEKVSDVSMVEPGGERTNQMIGLIGGEAVTQGTSSLTTAHLTYQCNFRRVFLKGNAYKL